MIQRDQEGYTIIEVLIFITVSAFMFVLAVISIGGRQQQVQFTQAVNDLDSKLQDIVNDVSTGYFPKPANISCTVSTAIDQPSIQALATDVGVGTSEDCTFIGKVIQFSPEDNNANTTNESRLFIYNLVGRRVTSGTAPTSIAEAKPVTDASLIESAELQWGLKVVRVLSSPATQVGSTGIFSSFAQDFETTTVSNSQGLNIAPITGTSLNQTSSLIMGRINTISDDPAAPGYVNITTAPETIICLRSGDDRRTAAIIMSGTGSTTTEVVYDTIPAGCPAP